MARPRKKLDELRVHQVSVRLTASENDYASAQAKLIGTSTASWLRLNALSKQELSITTTPMHREYYKQIVGLSTNTNQIAKKLNQQIQTEISGDILENILEVRELLSKIYALFQK